MPSTDPVYVEMVDVIAESLFSMDPQRAHVIACFAAQAVLARWPHIAGPERVETVDRVVDERCVLCRYPDPLETGCTACRPDATNPEEGTR